MTCRKCLQEEFFMNIIMRFLINGLVLLVIDWLLDSITIKSYGTALLAVFIL